LEYPVWSWLQPHADFAPRAPHSVAWRLDISEVLALKRQAIAQYRSQLGKLIRDDPDGFVLEPQFLAYFQRPWELFIEASDV
jgi:hypothetical protein